jgi:DNA-directed RNA polymerase III subunit RPC2
MSDLNYLSSLWSNLSVSELSSPVKSLNDKYLLLPAFLRLRGLVKQHIDSFNYFLSTELKAILLANNKVLCEADPGFYMKYLDIRIGLPSIEEGESLTLNNLITPHECRLRDMTYAAPILVDIEYIRGKNLIRRENVCIGRIPIMLRSQYCILANKNEAELAELKECLYDPGGYFIVKGQEKVIMIQGE